MASLLSYVHISGPIEAGGLTQAEYSCSSHHFADLGTKACLLVGRSSRQTASGPSWYLRRAFDSPVRIFSNTILLEKLPLLFYPLPVGVSYDWLTLNCGSATKKRPVIFYRGHLTQRLASIRRFQPWTNQIETYERLFSWRVTLR